MCACSQINHFQIEWSWEGFATRYCSVNNSSLLFDFIKRISLNVDLFKHTNAWSLDIIVNMIKFSNFFHSDRQKWVLSFFVWFSNDSDTCIFHNLILISFVIFYTKHFSLSFRHLTLKLNLDCAIACNTCTYFITLHSLKKNNVLFAKYLRVIRKLFRIWHQRC